MRMRKKIMAAAKAAWGRICRDLKAFWPMLLVFAGYNILVRKIFHAFCPQLIVTGFPCAGCGMTRAMFYMLTGRFGRGMRLNPSAVFWLAFFIWYFWNRYVRGVRPRSMMCVLGVVGAITLLIYLYRMLNCFPGDPPMVFYRENIIHRLLTGGTLSE